MIAAGGVRFDLTKNRFLEQAEAPYGTIRYLAGEPMGDCDLCNRPIKVGDSVDSDFIRLHTYCAELLNTDDKVDLPVVAAARRRLLEKRAAAESSGTTAAVEESQDAVREATGRQHDDAHDGPTPWPV